jgi:dTDP-4-amino-4,6-dideoxygalactose transaminase
LISLDEENITVAASGASALTGAILATAGRAGAEKPVAVVPDHTFVATALAAEQCGYRVRLADIDPVTWSLDPEALSAQPDLGDVGLVVVVAPYGRAVSQAPWLEFQQRTGIPVVIDGAASLETLVREPDGFLGPIPVMLSLHATKAFASGEGGAVACSDTQLLARTVQALNFGFYDSRDCAMASINGKMSEYHAAVGLAELDGWAAKQAVFQRVHATYRRIMTQACLADRFLGSPEAASCYALFRCESAGQAEAVKAALDANRVGRRHWYGLGLHAQSHFSACEQDELSVSRNLGACLLGLPVAPDLSEQAIAWVVQCIRDAIETGA